MEVLAVAVQRGREVEVYLGNLANVGCSLTVDEVLGDVVDLALGSRSFASTGQLRKTAEETRTRCSALGEILVDGGRISDSCRAGSWLKSAVRLLISFVPCAVFLAERSSTPSCRRVRGEPNLAAAVRRSCRRGEDVLEPLAASSKATGFAEICRRR